MGVSLFGLLVSLYYTVNPNSALKYSFAAFFGLILVVSLFTKDSSAAGYVIASVLGLIISLIFANKPPDAWLVSPETWGVTFSVFFAVMLVSAIISMTYAQPEDFVELETKVKKKRK
jgi:Na+/proline symporter